MVETINTVWSKYILQKFTHFFQRKYLTFRVMIQKQPLRGVLEKSYFAVIEYRHYYTC